MLEGLGILLLIEIDNAVAKTCAVGACATSHNGHQVVSPREIQGLNKLLNELNTGNAREALQQYRCNGLVIMGFTLLRAYAWCFKCPGWCCSTDELHGTAQGPVPRDCPSEPVLVQFRKWLTREPLTESLEFFKHGKAVIDLASGWAQLVVQGDGRAPVPSCKICVKVVQGECPLGFEDHDNNVCHGQDG